MRIFAFIVASAVIAISISGCLLFKGRFSDDGMWVWNKDPEGRYNAHNPLRLPEAEIWVNRVLSIPGIKKLQVEKTSKKWDHYNLNDSTLFFNLSNQELPNYHSYHTFAERLRVHPDSLKELILDFDKLGLNRFYREEEFLAFRTVTYFDDGKGYLYFFDSSGVKKINPGDTLDFRLAKEFKWFRLPLISKLVILKKYNDHWIEWQMAKEGK